MLKKKQNKQSGFTLVELLVTVAIFAMFITIASGSLVNVLKMEQKVNVLRQTQTSARYILETISREARNANGELDANGNRTARAYSVINYGTYYYLYIYSTDISANKATRVLYLSYFSTYATPSYQNKLYRYVYEKTLTPPGAYALVSSSVINNSNDLRITSLTSSTTSPADLSMPQKLTMILKAESGQGVGAIKEEYRASVEFRTAVTPRNY